MNDVIDTYRSLTSGEQEGLRDLLGIESNQCAVILGDGMQVSTVGVYPTGTVQITVMRKKLTDAR